MSVAHKARYTNNRFPRDSEENMQFHREWVLFSKEMNCLRARALTRSLAPTFSLRFDRMRFSRAPAIASFSLFVHQLFETCVCVFFPLIFPLPLSPLLSLASSYIFSACSHCSYLWCSHLLPKLSFISSVSLFTFVSITVFYSAILLFAQRRRIYRKNIREEIAWCCTVKCERILNENDSREKKETAIGEEEKWVTATEKTSIRRRRRCRRKETICFRWHGQALFKEFLCPLHTDYWSKFN